jgi:hypothetical protein
LNLEPQKVSILQPGTLNVEPGTFLSSGKEMGKDDEDDGGKGDWERERRYELVTAQQGDGRDSI